MTLQDIKKDAFIGLGVLQQAVQEELEKKAKLGQQVVIAGRNGQPKVVSAKSLIDKKRKR